MPKIWNTYTAKCWWGCEAKRTKSLIVGMKSAHTTLEASLAVFTKLNVLFPYDPAIMLLGTYQRIWKLCPCKNLHAHVNSSCIHNCHNLEVKSSYFSVSECINRLWYIQTMTYYLLRKRHVLLGHEEWRRNLKCIFLCERS